MSVAQYIYKLIARTNEQMSQKPAPKINPWRQQHHARVNPLISDAQRRALKDSQQTSLRRGHA